MGLKVDTIQNPTSATVNLTLDTSGNVTAGANLSVTGATTLAGNPTTTGTVVMGSSFLRNRIINGDMRIDQRNAGASVATTTTSAFTYTIDRWAYYATQASKFTVQRNAGAVTSAVGFSNYLGMTSTSAYSATSTDIFLVSQAIEGFNFSDLAFGTANAKTVTLSFQVYSSLTGTHSGSLSNQAGTQTYPFTFTVSSANTWTSVSITIPGSTTGTWNTDNNVGAYLFFNMGCGSTKVGTAGAWTATVVYGVTGSVSVVGTSSATFYITGVQLEVGTVATPFERRQYGQELLLCQRYYEQLSTTGGFNAIGGAGVFTTTTQFRPYVTYQTKRTSPTLTSSAASTFVAVCPAGNLAGSAISLGAANTSAAWLNLTVSGATAGQAGFTADNNATAYLGFSAEL